MPDTLQQELTHETEISFPKFGIFTEEYESCYMYSIVDFLYRI